MTEYGFGYVSGAVFGFILVVVLAVAIKKMFGKKGNEHYDERQELIRGKGYKISFMTVILLNYVYAMFFYGFFKEIVSTQFVMITIGFIGIVVYAVYCILNDAYVQVGQKFGRWIAVIVLVIAANLLSFFANHEQGLTVDGFATGRSLNLMIAVMFGVILLSFGVKRLMDGKENSDEES